MISIEIKKDGYGFDTWKCNVANEIVKIVDLIPRGPLETPTCQRCRSGGTVTWNLLRVLKSISETFAVVIAWSHGTC